jgi:hypothetical protein
MKPPTADNRFFTFRFPHLDTILRLEVRGENVTIYASRNTFSERHKELFIRELAAEAFIPDDTPRGFGSSGGVLCGGVRWLLDDELVLDRASDAKAQRLSRRIFASAFVLVVVFFSSILGINVRDRGNSASSRLTESSHGSPMAQR